MTDTPRVASVQPPSTTIFYGWWNVLVCFVGLALSYAMFTVFIFGTFIAPLEAEFGWQRGPMSLALTIANITVVVASPLLGALVDRIGVRRVMVVSTGLLGLCVAAMSQLNGDIKFYYLMHLLIPLLGAGTLPLGYARVMVAWFARRRGLALGISLSGFGVGATLMPTLAQFIIENWGWREAYLIFAAMILLISFPMTFFVLRENPGDMGLQPDGERLAAVSGDVPPVTDAPPIIAAPPIVDASGGLSHWQALGTHSYWLILGSFGLVGVGITSVLAHLVPMLIGRGFSPSAAAMCMSTLGFGLIFGRVFAGYLMDHYFAPYVTGVFLLGLLLGVVILATGTAGPTVFFAALLVGLATGSEISEIAYIVSRYFGARAFGQIYGVMFSAFQLGSAAGAYAMGRYYDSTGTYIQALWFVAGLVAIGTLLIVLLGRYPDLEAEGAR